jgi:hypothetical protein
VENLLNSVLHERIVSVNLLHYELSAGTIRFLINILFNLDNRKFASRKEIRKWKTGFKPVFHELGGILRAERNFSLSFLISSTREITRQKEIPLRAKKSA